MNFFDIIQLAIKSIRGNMLRSVITLSIIAIGIMALVGILTATDAIKSSISTNFSALGANSFTILRKGDGIQFGHGRRKRAEPITYEQAMEFKERYDFPAKVALRNTAVRLATLRYKEEKTNPNIFVNGITETYVDVNGLDIEYGRNFGEAEIENANSYIIIGPSIAKKLFKKPRLAIDNILTINARKYKVIGVLESKGSSGVFNSDNAAFIPITNARLKFPDPNENYRITVAGKDALDIDGAISEATGLMRSVRKLTLSEPDDFEFQKSDKLATIFIDQIDNVAWAAYIIGFITLFGAGIGLMNIMLVSVTERTREIGITKAIGARNNTVLMQFLGEAIVICQMGGIAGIIAGIIIGNLVSVILKGPFVIPWLWMLMGMVFCMIVGVVAGIYPAYKAAQLDPIESLRYE